MTSRLLTYEEIDGNTVISAWMGGLPHRFEPAGKAFLEAQLKQAGHMPYFEHDESESGSSSSDEEAEDAAKKTHHHHHHHADDEAFRGKGKKKKSDRKDLYALLGLGNERWMANDAQIKAAYRKMCLIAHPDKCGAVSADAKTKEALEERFRDIQLAYETLSNPAKRREFDSLDAMDDTLPTSCADGDFFKVFGSAFRRQSRWSEAKPVPEVGDDDTPIEKVQKFYDFWFRFKSWREFPHPDEEDEEMAESRDHRRWIQRNNAKLRKKGKQDEAKQISAFVNAAFDNDPRLKRAKAMEREEKEARKRAKEEERLAREEEERKKKAEEEAQRAAEEERLRIVREEEKVRREAEKKAMKKERQRLRALCVTCGGIDDAACEKLCAKLTLEELKAVCQSMDNHTPEVARKAFLLRHDELRATEAEDERLRREQSAKLEASMKSDVNQVHKKKMDEMKPWDEEEMRMLDRGLKKFPVGTSRRWEQVTAYVRTRTQEEILLMVKEALNPSSPYAKFLTGKKEGFKIPEKRKVNLVNTVEASVRYDDEVNTPDASQEEEASAREEDAVSNATTASSGAATAKTTTSTWTEAQELALVKALKAFPKELGQERWAKVAEAVGGKTKAECFKRFKELSESFREKKAAAAGG